MKILILDSAPTSTTHSGKALRLIHILQRLGRRHELHFAGIVGPDDPETVPAWLRGLVASTRIWRRREAEFALGRYVNWLTLQPWFYAPWRYPDDYKTLSHQVREAVRHEEFDLVHCFDEEVAQFIPDALPCPWVADPADAMALHAMRRSQQASGMAQRWRWGLMARRLACYEHQLVGRADATVFVSPVDAAGYLNNGTRRRVQVIPNGVDTEYFSATENGTGSLFAIATDKMRTGTIFHAPALLFTGHMSFEPNRDAAMALIDDVLPRVRAQVPEAVCYIVGADPTADLTDRHDGRHVFVTGRVDDLRPYFAQASVYVCPMRLGAGIKNKLLEAMAMGCPIVTTRRGAEGLDVQDGTHVRLADTPEAIADGVLSLLRHPAEAAALRHAARAYVVERHSWDRVAETYEALYRLLVDSPETVVRSSS